MEISQPCWVGKKPPLLAGEVLSLFPTSSVGSEVKAGDGDLRNSSYLRGWAGSSLLELADAFFAKPMKERQKKKR